MSVDRYDACLPQTQCGECGFDGCLPYATALATGSAEINLCPPGGVDTLKALAKLSNQDPSPYLEELRQKKRPPTKAIIIEQDCIGCTKCIQACPVDAIIGSAKKMHTIIAKECTGCELCVPACPVDCIELEPINTLDFDKTNAIKRKQAKEIRANAPKKPKQKKHTPNHQASEQDKADYLKDIFDKANI